ncbi:MULTISPECIES: copper homeostasis membrane protein CopD [Sphingomonadaceae]|uniref:Putative copper resistance protein D n=1 Tax=Sphingobium subterraneum TaxID=627688 RepID=A0A841J3N7_9SPHN|nr:MULTISPECIES: copper homeostasis membrane protein CopD [Sphingomonadaceae]MBB6125593.1 putative copper resistance protein D [Sphingobium subterraneum]CAH0498977.1 Copper resistance protein D [Novosphingobium sp. CECT 9465]
MTEAVSIAIRSGLYLDLMALFGLPLFGLYALRGAERATGSVLPFRSILAWGSILGIALSVLAMMVLAASMADVPITEVDRATLTMLITGTSIGTAWLVRLLALVASGLCALLLRWRPILVLQTASLCGAIALATLAWAGHGAADEGLTGWVHLSADILHLWAAGIWIGALLAMLLLLFMPPIDESHDRVVLSHRALHGFGIVGSGAVAALIASGLVNSWILVGPAHLGDLFTTLYGQLLLVKLMLFALMLVLAGANRFVYTPALATAMETGDTGSAVRSLRRSLALESTIALLVLGLVAWLGLLPPPASAM